MNAPIEYECDSFRLVDVSAALPRRSDEHYLPRDPVHIRELNVHQTQGNAKTPVPAALINEGEYFCQDKDKGGRGWPGFAYTFWVPFAPLLTPAPSSLPIVYRTQRDDVYSYHTKTRSTVSVAVAFQGHFRSKNDAGAGKPSDWQRTLFRSFVPYLLEKYSLSRFDLFGHCDWGKEDCPGEEIELWISTMRADHIKRIHAPLFADWIERQAALVAIGALERGKVSDSYGTPLRLAVEALQRKQGMPVTGLWSRPVDTYVRNQLARGDRS